MRPPLTSMTSKTALPNILKIASKNAFFPKIDGRYESLGEIALKTNVLSFEGWQPQKQADDVYHILTVQTQEVFSIE